MTLENGDVKKVAEALAEVEDPHIERIFKQRQRQQWLMILAGSLITLCGIFAVTFMDIGGY